MNCDIEEFFYDSSNGKDKIHAKIYVPGSEKIKGIIQFSHGMCECVDKYKEFINFVVNNNYVFCGNDHLGHGRSINSEDEKGFFASKNGYKYVVNDLYKMTKYIKKRFPNLPIFLIGHSMGSFIARCYASKYGNNINGLLLCGTIGPQWPIEGGIQLADRIIKKHGELYRSKTLDKLSFEFANINFEPVKTRYDWTCSNEEAIKDHLRNKESQFIFTASGFKDLFYLVKNCNDEKIIKDTPKNLPMFIFSGSMDPIGENGIGIKKVVEIYKKMGIKDVEYKLYADKRHEMLRETNMNEVFADILNWIEAVKFGEE